MKKIIGALAIAVGFTLPISSRAHDHAKHNMVLFGEQQIFASHIVYKQPHNFQAILELTLDPQSRAKLLDAKRAHPNNQFIYLLDHMDISQIATSENISGPVFFTDDDGNKQEVIQSLSLTKRNFRIIYFDEVPLSLAKP